MAAVKTRGEHYEAWNAEQRRQRVEREWALLAAELALLPAETRERILAGLPVAYWESGRPRSSD